MFGYSPEELARLRRPPPKVRPLIVLVWLALHLVLLLGVSWADRLYRPGGLQPLLDRATQSAKFTLRYGDLVMLPVGEWRDPDTWRFALSDLAFRPKNPVRPEWSVRRATLTWPAFEPEGEAHRRIHWRRLEVFGLHVQTHQQRPPDPWTPANPWVTSLMADEVLLRGASYDAPADPPLGAAHLEGLTGLIRGLEYRPGVREVSGKGDVRAASFRTGAITVTDVLLPTFVLDRSDLRFEGTVGFAGKRPRVRGSIENFHVKSAVDLRVVLDGAPLDVVVQTATGREAPVSGSIDVELAVKAGGELPRGGAVMDGVLRLRDGRIALARNTRYVLLDAVRIAPWVRLNQANEVELEPMLGRIRLTRGTVTLKELMYPVGRRELRLDGTIAKDDLYLLVRLLPAVQVLGDADRKERAGLGVIVEGDRMRQTFRLADRDELLSKEPWRRPEVP